MYVRVYVRVCVSPDLSGGITPIYACISKLFDTNVVQEKEKCRLKHF